jgi:hypothetical protein
MSKGPFLKECKEISDFLMDFLDKKLPRGEMLIFRMHLLLCPKCRHYMTRYKSSVDIAKNIMDDPPPVELVNLTTEFLSKRAKQK